MDDHDRRGRTYVTTAIPYVNARPHLGFALELVQADALARDRRLRGDDTRFLTGTDENSLKNVQAAAKAGVPVAQFVDLNAATFVELGAALHISNDDFIRTAVDPRHLAGAAAFWRACARNGDIYRQTYRGLYCVGCEQYYAPDDLVDGMCPEHSTTPELVDEENYFFRLSRYQQQLEHLIDSGALRITPESRRNEVRAFVAAGLRDISISRSRARAHDWGIAVPDDPEQVMYVWFDALTNYITALGYGGDDDLYRHYWSAADRRVHVIGKGILRFHAVYWPAMLLSAGEPLPTDLFVHGYLTFDRRKMSKSLGNVADPFALVESYGVDAVRYWLLAEVPPTQDADYGEDRLRDSYVDALANRLGNLLNRVVSMTHRYRDGIVPGGGNDLPELRRVAAQLDDRVRQAMDASDFRAAMAAIWEVVDAANRAVDTAVPWTLARAERSGESSAASRLDAVLHCLLESFVAIGHSLRPFLPDTAARIARQLEVDVGGDPHAEWGRLSVGTRLSPPEPLFPRLPDPAADA